MSELPALTSRAQLQAVQLATKWVNVPEWGVRVLVSELTGEEVERWRQSLMRKGKVDLDPRAQRMRTARFLCMAIRDENGERIYSDHDAALILRLGSGGMERVAKVALRLSGLGVNEDDEAEDDMPEVEANLEPTRNGSSSFDSLQSYEPELSPSS